MWDRPASSERLTMRRVRIRHCEPLFNREAAMIDAVLDFKATANVHSGPRNAHRLSALWRLWRIRRARRAMLRRVLAETVDPRVIEDVGLTSPDPSGLELFARALLRHRR
jgi:hypothetical protein